MHGYSEKILTKINQIGLFGFSLGWTNFKSTEHPRIRFEIGDYTTKIEKQYVGQFAAKIPLSIVNYGDEVAFNIYFLAYIHFPEESKKNDIVLNHMHCQLKKINPNESIFIGDVYIPSKIINELVLSFMEDDHRRPAVKTIITCTDLKQKQGIIVKQLHYIQPNYFDEYENGQITSYSIFQFFSKKTDIKPVSYRAIKDINTKLIKKHNELSFVPKIFFKKNL